MNFKILSSAALCGLLATSCSGKKAAEVAEATLVPVNDYTLTVTNIPLADSTTIYLMNLDAQETRGFDVNALVDSAMVLNGQAVFEGNGVNAPVVVVANEDWSAGNYVLLENDSISFNVTTNEVISPVNVKFQEFNDSLSAKYQELTAALPAEDDVNYEAAVENAQAEIESLVNGYMNNNLDNSLGYLIFISNASSMDADDFNALIEKAPALASTKKGADIKARFDAKAATAAGQKYTDYEVEYNGKTTKLSDYVKPGQYTLVDYWASWCGPCKRAIETELKPIYAEYNPKGLEIVSVAVWEDPEQTEAWLTENPLPWPVMLNAQNIPSDIYGFNGIPCIMLIDPEGTIVARELFGEEILEAVKNAFPEAE